MSRKKNITVSNKVTVNIPDWVNKRLVGKVNFFRILADELKADISRHNKNQGDSKLVKKTLHVDHHLVELAKANNINLSQCLYKVLCKYMDAEEEVQKYKKNK